MTTKAFAVAYAATIRAQWLMETGRAILRLARFTTAIGFFWVSDWAISASSARFREAQRILRNVLPDDGSGDSGAET